MPTISVIVPIFKAEKFMHRALDSVIAQTYQDWEIICINDCSPDNSAVALEKYAAFDKRIRVFNFEKNVGPGAVRNFGIENATGEYIMFLDADDSIHPQAMEILLTLARRDNSDVVTYTYDRWYRPELMVRQILRIPYKNVKPHSVKRKYNIEKIKTLFTDNVINHVTERSHVLIKWPIKHGQVWKFFVRREFVKDIKFPELYVYEDVPWWLRVVLRRPRVTITQLPIYFYYPNFGSILLSYKELAKFKDLCAVLKNFPDMLKKADANQKAIINREFLWEFIIHGFRHISRLDADGIKYARGQFKEMDAIGLFENPPHARAKRFLRKIRMFIA